MLDGCWSHQIYQRSYFSKLKLLHIKTGCPETLESVMQFNKSIIELHVHCAAETKNKFSGKKSLNRQ